MGRACSTNGGAERAYRVLVKRLEENRPLGRPKHTWEDNIKMGLQEAEWKGLDWIDLIWLLKNTNGGRL